MKQYDRIYIPVKDQAEAGRYLDATREFIWTDKSLSSYPIKSIVLKEQERVIVFTLEEVREMWSMARSGPDYPGTFELFLKSKGINTLTPKP